MFHFAAFGKTSANLGAGVYDALTAISDGYLSVNTNSGRFLVPGGQSGMLSPWRLAFKYAQGTTMSVARIFNAWMRQIAFPTISPIRAGLTIDSAFNFDVPFPDGPEIPYMDEFGIDADSAAAEVQTAGLILHDGAMLLPPGKRYTVRFTSTITSVANAWSNGTISLIDNLPPGKYAVIGADLIGTALIFFRIQRADAGPRPGIPGRASLAIYPSNQFRYGALGEWLRFDAYALPYLDVFCSSAGAKTFTGYLDVVKLP